MNKQELVEYISNLPENIREIIEATPFDHLSELVFIDRHYFDAPPGQEHYRFFAHLSYQLDPGSLIFEAGTRIGHSALAFAANPDVKVVSYDIRHDQRGYPPIENIEYCIGDMLADPRLLEADLIFVDTEHEGSWEYEVYQFLKKSGWKGVTLWDDTLPSWFPQMTPNFLAKVVDRRIDLTHIGHICGTEAIILE
jgi:hypothetical protein